MASVSIRELLEAGIHFGHQTRRWNPKMKPYIFGERNGIHIVDLQKTAEMFNRALNFISAMAGKGEKVLFVGTKKQAQSAIEEEAGRAKTSYVNKRWLGGTLTNFSTIKKSLNKMDEIEAVLAEGSVERLSKKEVLMHERELAKLMTNLGGIRQMNKLPGAIFVVDVKKEKIAVKEANKMAIPVIAIVDTNCDPDNIDYVIPGNDDALRAINFVVKAMADAYLEGIEAHKAMLVGKGDKGEAADHSDAGAEGVEVIVRKLKKQSEQDNAV
ncbi:MAG: 30S ribosomal protein S2 [Deltaproteobacteria bacterium]|nr:30S ribosomal protein S2 [Deltaproteobacteria bacterium]